MKIFKKILYHYFIGVGICATIVGFIVLFDYSLKGYLQYPELINLIDVCLLGGFGFGLAHFAYTETENLNKKNN